MLLNPFLLFADVMEFAWAPGKVDMVQSLGIAP